MTGGHLRPGLHPGRCKRKAHRREYLGYAGRRVLVSRKWSGKTLADHKGDRREWLMSTLGISATDPARYIWEPVAPGDPGHTPPRNASCTSSADRKRWHAALTEARRRASESAVGATAVCPACQVTAGGPGTASADEQLAPASWAWTDPAAARALRNRRLGPILRAYRTAVGLTQEQLAARLGYDKTYVSMIETGRRAVHDVQAPRELRHSFVSILSASGVPMERISDLVGHRGTNVTETVYRHEIRSALTTGATAMNKILAIPNITARSTTGNPKNRSRSA